MDFMCMSCFRAVVENDLYDAVVRMDGDKHLIFHADCWVEWSGTYWPDRSPASITPYPLPTQEILAARWLQEAQSMLESRHPDRF